MAVVNLQEKRDQSLTPERLTPLWRAMTEHLETNKRTLLEEIKHYPRPITACDAQFNYLLEVRLQLSRDIRQVRVMAEMDLRDLTEVGGLKGIFDFITNATTIHDEVKDRFRGMLPHHD